MMRSKNQTQAARVEPPNPRLTGRSVFRSSYRSSHSRMEELPYNIVSGVYGKVPFNASSFLTSFSYQVMFFLTYNYLSMKRIFHCLRNFRAEITGITNCMENFDYKAHNKLVTLL